MKQSHQEIIDPICGMDIGEFPDRATVMHKGTQLHFCGDFCKDRFLSNPERFSREPQIQVRNLWKTFQMGDSATHALRGVSIRVWQEDFVAIIGASGSGKSTLLNMLGLLDRPTSGEILLRGKPVVDLPDIEKAELRSKTFGFVFQQYNLVPWFTAYENVILPRIFANLPIDQQRVTQSFESIGLGKRMHHRPTELSGGEQQRVAVLRSLVNDPQIIIGDEPTGNLDSETGNRLLDMLIELNKKQKKTLVIVTHDADIAAKADQVIAIKDGKIMRDHKTYKKIYTE